ncbi:pimeloyl-ACP methyl ester carboxylesterase [Nocardioides daedukensis]|uniref:Pimeloyl-ACP methyl ester carboxylesterase n=1 Tax=Nocardioides daedukensis TaxID=634462 RepID=A0A7Y9UUA2_9ACTN|nr:alpha/beta fold hydrolase [Nocardioides daedukensis]NYG60374.1 pimeloyl-ACP methyl ester carboxylesterase [Nocardioides daedukensis]
MGNSLADFLAPDGFTQPRMHALLKELAVAPESGRAILRAAHGRRELRATPYVDRSPQRAGEPVLLVPGFLAGDYTLRLLARTLRSNGFRTYRSQITSNVSCLMGNSSMLERRLEAIATKRERKVRVVGHSLGGMLARGLAVRRPDLVSGIITMGSPMLAPGTSHPVLLTAADVLVRLSRAGVPGLMNESCVAGDCARLAWEESRQPMPEGVGFTCIWSHGDGLVDPLACVDPASRSIEVRASHIGLAIDPRVADCVVAELRAQDATVIARPTAS